MNINKTSSVQGFKGISIPKNMPKEIVKAIKANPVIKKASKHYSLAFWYEKNPKNNVHYTTFTMSSPNTDSMFSLITTPPHSIKREFEYLGTRTNGILKKLDEIRNTPDYFEKKLGTPRTLKQRIQAFLEAWKIAFMPKDNRTVLQEIQLDKILKKYENLNIPQ